MAKHSTNWGNFDNLIEAASADTPEGQNLREILQYGTPAKKLEVLTGYGITWEELVATHKRLSNIIYTGSLKWWFW